MPAVLCWHSLFSAVVELQNTDVFAGPQFCFSEVWIRMHEITDADSISVEKFQEFLVYFLVGFEFMGELRYMYRRLGIAGDPNWWWLVGRMSRFWISQKLRGDLVLKSARNVLHVVANSWRSRFLPPFALTFWSWCLCIWSLWMPRRLERLELHRQWYCAIGKKLSLLRRAAPLLLSWQRPRTCSWTSANPAKSGLSRPTWNLWDVVERLLGTNLLSSKLCSVVKLETCLLKSLWTYEMVACNRKSD
jgi:hypothetical protein